MPENANPNYTPAQREAYRPASVELEVNLRHEHWLTDDVVGALKIAIKEAVFAWRPMEGWRVGVSSEPGSERHGLVDCHSLKMSYSGRIPEAALALPPRTERQFGLELTES
jgi:hypothetical protein